MPTNLMSLPKANVKPGILHAQSPTKALTTTCLTIQHSKRDLLNPVRYKRILVKLESFWLQTLLVFLLCWHQWVMRWRRDQAAEWVVAVVSQQLDHEQHRRQ